MAWYDFFLNEGTQSQDISDYISAILYAIIFFASLIFAIILVRKSKEEKSEIVAYRTIILIYIGVMIAVSILSFENFIVLYSNLNVKGNPSMLITIIGYTVILYALNLFLLLSVKFRQNTKRIIILLASVEASLMVIIDLVMVLSVFFELPTAIEDFAVIILGAVVILAVIFSIISISNERRNTANKLTKIKLTAAMIAILGFLLDGLANLVNIVLDSTGIIPEFRSIYIGYIVPIMAIIFYSMLLFGFYYSVDPPARMQRRLGVLPPSFTEIMKDQEKVNY